jgi:outer membrane protein TolC
MYESRLLTCLLLLALHVLIWTAAAGAEAAIELAARAGQAPAVVAAQQRVLAAQARARAAGVPADAMLRLEGMRMADMGENGYEAMLEQPLPRWGELGADRAMAAADVRMAEAEHAEALGRTMMDVVGHLVTAQAADAEAEIDADIARRARRLAELMAAAVGAGGAGGAGIREALSLETRAAAMDLMAADRTRMAMDARGRAAALLGLESHIPLPPIPDPPTAILPERVPAVRMAAARELAAEAQRSMARSRGRPELSLLLRARRFADVPEEDEYAAGIGISLPLFRPAYAAGVEAASARVAATRREAEGERLAAVEAVARAARAVAQAQATEKFVRETADRLERELEAVAAEVATSAGGAATAMLYDRFDQLGDVRREAVRAQAEAGRMRADLWMLAPPETP